MRTTLSLIALITLLAACSTSTSDPSQGINIIVNNATELPVTQVAVRWANGDYKVREIAGNSVPPYSKEIDGIPDWTDVSWIGPDGSLHEKRVGISTQVAAGFTGTIQLTINPSGDVTVSTK